MERSFLHRDRGNSPRSSSTLGRFEGLRCASPHHSSFNQILPGAVQNIHDPEWKFPFVLRQEDSQLFQEQRGVAFVDVQKLPVLELQQSVEGSCSIRPTCRPSTGVLTYVLTLSLLQTSEKEGGRIDLD